tara:strand:+ start:1129 stop:1359 length:231 start_codon:yes stop_codon:yes gene_type:complete
MSGSNFVTLVKRFCTEAADDYAAAVLDDDRPDPGMQQDFAHPWGLVSESTKGQVANALKQLLDKGVISLNVDKLNG